MLDKDLIQKWLDKGTINNAQVEKMKGDLEPIKKITVKKFIPKFNSSILE